MKQMAKKAVALLLDVCKAAAIGIGIAAVLGLALAGAGALFGSNGIHSAVEAAKDGLLLVFAVLLLIVAGMLLIKGKKQENIRLDENWRKHFPVIGPKTMLLALAAGMLVVIYGVDAFQMAIG